MCDGRYEYFEQIRRGTGRNDPICRDHFFSVPDQCDAPRLRTVQVHSEVLSMEPFYLSHKALIGELSQLVIAERDESRKIGCEGKIYAIYINLKESCPDMPHCDVIIALLEIDALERMALMDHYFYDVSMFTDYRAEYPVRTTAIAIDILLALENGRSVSHGLAYLITSFVNARVALVDRSYPKYSAKARELLAWAARESSPRRPLRRL